ncbi:ABC transporter permease subunit [Peptostreptococcaceae bacterium AGR-M142]
MNKIKPYIYVFPAVFIVFLLSMIAFTNLLKQSLGYFPQVGLTDYTLKYYIETFKEGSFRASLYFSLYTAFLSAILSIILGIIFSYILVVNDRENKYLDLIYKLPILLPHTIIAFCIYNLISKTGLISRVLFNIGIINDFSNFHFFNFYDNGLGIILAYIFKQVPFVCFLLYIIMNKIDKDYKLMSLNLGASKTYYFFRVLLPLCKNSLLSTFLMIFSYSLFAYEIPALLGGAKIKALPILAYMKYTASDLKSRPYAMVINSIMVFISLFIIYIYSKLSKNNKNMIK